MSTKAWYVLLFSVLCHGTGWASSLLVTVTDAQGQRLEHAVISVHGDKPIPAASGTRAVMDQRARQFAPTVLPIQQGTEVSFPNTDDVRHHVYSFSFPNNFELKLYHGEASTPVRFEHAGIVALGCNIHDGMVGFLQVVDTPWFSKTGNDGMAALDGVPSGNYTLQVWHPDLGVKYVREPLTLTNGHQSKTIALQTEQVRRTEKRTVSPLQSLFED